MPDEPQSPERRGQILDAALRVFAARGFHKATIKQIAAEAGLKSPALIYWYFRDKRELLDALADRFLPFRQVPIPLDALMDMPPDFVLTMVMKTFLHTFSTPAFQLLLRVFIGESLQNPDVAGYFRSIQETGVQFIERYLAHQVARGALRPHDTRTAARMVMGTALIRLLGSVMFPWMVEGLPPIDDYVDHAVAVLLDGLRAPRRG